MWRCASCFFCCSRLVVSGGLKGVNTGITAVAFHALRPYLKAPSIAVIADTSDLRMVETPGRVDSLVDGEGPHDQHATVMTPYLTLYLSWLSCDVYWATRNGTYSSTISPPRSP